MQSSKTVTPIGYGHTNRKGRRYNETLIISYMQRMLDYKGMSQRAYIWNLNSHVFKDFVESEIRQRITYLKTIGKADLK